VAKPTLGAPSLWVVGDPLLLPIAIGNLIDNARKYGSSPQAVSVEVKPWLSAEIAVEVTNDGPAIPPDEMAKIFEKYYRQSTTLQKPGSGLGLYIVKNIAERHQGRVEVQQETATTFRIVLPEFKLTETSQNA
jgi:signal transduction histidine kinase